MGGRAVTMMKARSVGYYEPIMWQLLDCTNFLSIPPFLLLSLGLALCISSFSDFFLAMSVYR
jgi:hypothetical protein